MGRILAVYGTILVLVLALQPQTTRRWRTGVWTGLTLMAVVEAFSRIYLSKHWTTDAVFALPFGAMLLMSNTAALSALTSRRQESRSTAMERTRRRSASSGSAEPLAV